MKQTFQHIRDQFPILQRQVHGKPLVYLDNAATTQKPQVILDALVDYYSNHNANVHRGVHALSDESTVLYEDSRQAVAGFFGADSSQLIVTRNTTEAMNLFVAGWARQHVKEDDVVLVSLLEHHSNLVPWQELARAQRARLVILPLLADGAFDFLAFQEAVREHKKHLAGISLPLISNALGTRLPIEQCAQFLQTEGIRNQVFFSVDAAQAAAHMPISLSTLGVDALAVSAHKMYGPMGIGGLILRKDWLAEFQPQYFGGGMIARVEQQTATFHEDASERFTAGTPDVAGLVGWAAACKWLSQIGWHEVQQHEHELLEYAYQKLQSVPKLHIVGPAPEHRSGSIAFTYDGVHAHDVAQILDRYGVAVRSGHHCTMPLHTFYNWVATTRASFAIYNTTQEIDTLVEALHSVDKVFTV